MTVSIDGYTFAGLTSHQCVEIDPFEFQNVEGVFFGAVGATEIRDVPHARTIRLPALLRGAASKQALHEAFIAHEAQANQKHGDLLVDGVLCENTTYVSLERLGQPAYDGSGVNGWWQRFVLVFRQLKRNS